MDERGFDSINVIPFIDIMLVLLTIVLTTSTFIASGALSVKLPKANTENVADLRSLTIEIEQTGVLHLDGRSISLPELESLLEPESRDRDILIRADRLLPLQGFVDVMDRIKRMGFARVSLQTEAR